MTYNEFTKGLALVLATFGNVKIQDNTIEAWFELLKDLQNEQFKYAVMCICEKESNFYPTTNFVGLVKSYLKQDKKLTAFNAWQAVVTAMQKSGGCQSVRFSDPVIHSVIEAMGGWMRVCTLPFDTWLERQFCEYYGYCESRQSHPEYCPGTYEIENRSKQYLDMIRPPRLYLVHGQERKSLNE